jgi:hypothetical protein
MLAFIQTDGNLRRFGMIINSENRICESSPEAGKKTLDLEPSNFPTSPADSHEA